MGARRSPVGPALLRALHRFPRMATGMHGVGARASSSPSLLLLRLPLCWQRNGAAGFATSAACRRGDQDGKLPSRGPPRAKPFGRPPEGRDDRPRYSRSGDRPPYKPREYNSEGRGGSGGRPPYKPREYTSEGRGGSGGRPPYKPREYNSEGRGEGRGDRPPYKPREYNSSPREGGSRFGGKPSYGDRPPYKPRSYEGRDERPRYGAKPEGREDRPYRPRTFDQDRPPRGERAGRGERAEGVEGEESEVPAWKARKDALAEKYPEGWNPTRRLSPDALVGVRALHEKDPEVYSMPALADAFKISPEAMRRILKSKWEPTSEEATDRAERWERRGAAVWKDKAAQGEHPPKKWREQGIGAGQARRPPVKERWAAAGLTEEQGLAKFGDLAPKTAGRRREAADDDSEDIEGIEDIEDDELNEVEFDGQDDALAERSLVDQVVAEAEKAAEREDKEDELKLKAEVDVEEHDKPDALPDAQEDDVAKAELLADTTDAEKPGKPAG